MKTLYTTRVTSLGGRDGNVRSDDGVLELRTAMPKEMGGSGQYTNPEQLFAAGYAACFESALNLALRQEKMKVKDTAVSTEVRLLFSEDEGYQLDVDIYVRIPGADPDSARSLMDKAHHTCPYSKAIEGNVNVNLQLSEA
jgi:lipoyl-dependent peroxiredoxin